ncbi:hypothetical protein [Burkholderia ambifaria]|uniref:hypothetical protein n=1 Tax=Burkholderia ambifaria TaxID=152480 RepID=UPI001FC87201|nr:hypothetical protein [Burkholderia ambifaria]
MHRNPPKPPASDPDPLDQMSWTDLETAIAHDDGEAAKSHLDAGHPVYIHDASTPKGLVTKIWPDGKREHVKFGTQGEIAIREASQDDT